MPIEHEHKLKMLLKMFHEQAQAYHLMCNICYRERHTSSTWKECQEDTCRTTRETLKRFELEDSTIHKQ